MLKISNITKDYILKDQAVGALKGVSINFRRSEFVSILGPSGCGKTTLLNIIGGLDRYTSGDLIIEGVSTKEFKDKDWDNYRNHRVGFVFQNYNLIPHQTVLENVELALTLSGIKKSERRARAVKVLERVGLGDKLKSKPNQLSGGQMQRVAIARALVNDPEIILADEPTGALDSKTSVQIMEILKEVSADRLVIMVTHNPDLAEQYSSRIIRLLDGELTMDSMPYSDEEERADVENHIIHDAHEAGEEPASSSLNLEAKDENSENRSDNLTNLDVKSASRVENPQLSDENSKNLDEKSPKKHKKKRKEKTSMSFFTALALSFKNLLSKKGRTAMVSFAGSIGIIGIALVLAVSAGMTNYIDNLQSESLASYPVSISSISVDMNNVLGLITDSGTSSDSNSSSNELTIYDATSSIVRLANYNYMSSDFVDYVVNYYSNASNRATLNDYQISYASDMHIVTTKGSGADQTYFPIESSLTMSALSGTTTSLFFEGLSNEDYVTSMYDCIGTYPTERNQVALVLSSSQISRTTLDSLGIEYNSNTVGISTTFDPISYDDIIGKTYKLVTNNDYYTSAGNYVLDFATISDATTTATQTTLASMYTSGNSIDLEITAILILKDDASGSIFNDGIMYTPALAEYYHENCMESTVVENIKSTYLTANGDGSYSFNTDATQIEFPKAYAPNISEMETYFSDYTSYFSYTDPDGMYSALTMTFGVDISYEEVIDLYLQMYGASSVPTGMYFYATDFDAKDNIVAMLNNWNSSVSAEGNKIVYTDSSELLTSMLGTMVDIVSYVLVAFASISLVVSSIMIGIITYTSVIERTKEIGVLRSIGASKRDVSRVFNAETIIIGLFAGVLGILIAGLITIPISALLKSLTGIAGLATMELSTSVILVVISVILTFIAGLIPASIASKKDPVQALRSE